MREIGKSSKKSFSFLKVFVLTILFLIITIGLVKLLNLEKYLIGGPKTVVGLITDSGLDSDEGRTNVLLMGIGGRGHEGPDLTDTIILASVDKGAKDVVLISIPRDLWVPNLSAKINSAYAYGQEEQNGQGLDLAKKTVSTLLGLPVHYAFRIDFNGFIRGVDLVGGLDIDVENSFADPKYPISGKEDELCGLTIETQEKDGVFEQVVKDATGSAIPLAEINDENDPFTCRYEELRFTKGSIRMDGATALKFVRSRHGTNGEGSDFARSTRQQKVILAFRQKVLSSETLTSPQKIIELSKTFGDTIDTDIKDEDAALFAKLGLKIDPLTVRRVILDTNEKDGRLEFGRPEDHGGQSVLIPKNNSWTDLAEYIQGEVFKLGER